MRVRPYRDSDVEVWWNWRRAVPGAKCYPHMHFFLCNGSQSFNESLEGLGEVPDSTRRRSHVLPVPGLLGDAPCGPPDWFEFGQPLTAVGECVPRADGIPSCCGGTPVVTGAAISGLTTYAVTPAPPPPPPAVPTGAAISGLTYVMGPPTGCPAPGSGSGDVTAAPLNQYCVIVWEATIETWWYWPTVTGAGYRISVIDDVCATGTWWLYSGDTAPPSGLLATGPGTSWPIDIVFNAPDTGIWFRFDSDCLVPKIGQIGLFDDETGMSCATAPFIGVDNYPLWEYGPGAHFWWQIGILEEGTTWWARRNYEGPSSGMPQIYIGDTCEELEYLPLTFPCEGNPYQGQFTMPRTTRVWAYTPTDQTITLPRFWRIVPGPVVC